MSRTEELIAKAQQGDREASEALVEENSGLIWSVARRFLGRGTEADDLYQLGCLGFLKAVEGFDLTYGTQFSTYAVPKIAGEIRRFLRDDGAVKVSRSLKEQAATIKAARSRLTGALGREPTIQEISRQTGFTPEEIALAETATAATESIQREGGRGLHTGKCPDRHGIGRTDGRENRSAAGDFRPAGTGADGHSAAVFPRPDPAAGGGGDECQSGAGVENREEGRRHASGADGLRRHFPSLRFAENALK